VLARFIRVRQFAGRGFQPCDAIPNSIAVTILFSVTVAKDQKYPGGRCKLTHTQVFHPPETTGIIIRGRRLMTDASAQLRLCI
jgi:hypothetical protein